MVRLALVLAVTLCASCRQRPPQAPTSRPAVAPAAKKRSPAAFSPAPFAALFTKGFKARYRYVRSQVSDIENVDGKGKPITPKPATHEAVVDCVVKAVHVVGGARISQFSCTLDRPMPSDPVTIEDKKDWTRDLEIGSATFIATKRGLWISDTELRNCDAACVAEQIKRKAAWPLPLRGYSVKRPDGDGRTQTAGLAATKIKLAGKQVVAWCADVAGRQGVEGHEEHTRCIDARGVLLSEENNSVVKQVRTTTTMTKLPAP